MGGFSVSSAERCMELLEMLASHPSGMGVGAISAALEAPQGEVRRLLGVLVQLGYVRPDEESGLYRPTLMIAAPGLRLLSSLHIPNTCQPTLERLAAHTGEVVRLSAIEGDRMLWIAKAEGSRSSQGYDPITGHDVPLHTTAMGKAWLATLPEDEAVQRVVERGFDVPLAGPNAIRDDLTLRAELRATAARGFGLAAEEAEAGVSAIGVLVRDGLRAGALPVAALSISGPSDRLSADRLVTFVPLLQEASTQLSRLWPVRHLRERRDACLVA